MVQQFLSSLVTLASSCMGAVDLIFSSLCATIDTSSIIGVVVHVSSLISTPIGSYVVAGVVISSLTPTPTSSSVATRVVIFSSICVVA